MKETAHRPSLAAPVVAPPRRPHLDARAGLVVVAVGSLAAWAALGGEYWSYVLNIGSVYALVALSLSVVGWMGEISLGHAAFMGFGVLLAKELQEAEVPFLLWFPALVVASIPVSLLVGAVSLRLQGIYLAIATLSFGMLADKAIFAKRLGGSGAVGADSGAVLEKPDILGWHVRSDLAYFFVLLAIVAVVVVVLSAVKRSGFGKALLALRNSQAGFVSLGYAPSRYRLAAFALSGAVATIAGALYGVQLGLVSGNPFTTFVSIFLYAVAVVGGVGGIAGPVVAGYAFAAWPYLLEEVLQDRAIQFANFQYGLAGALVIILVMFLPGGFQAVIDKGTAAIQARSARRAARREVRLDGGDVMAIDLAVHETVEASR